MNRQVEITAPHLRNLQKKKRRAVMDLSACTPAELEWLADEEIVSIKLFQRTVLALAQNGVEQVTVRYNAAQSDFKDRFADDRLIHSLLSWVLDDGAEDVAAARRLTADGDGYFLANPLYLANVLLLNAFDDAMQASPPAGVCDNAVSGPHLLWVPAEVSNDAIAREPGDWVNRIIAAPRTSVTLAEPEAAGVLLSTEADLKTADRLLCDDVVRKKGGYFAKLLNEHISLWIAKKLAPTSVTPNMVTLVNGILGVLSGVLVLYGGLTGSYWPVGAGALLFYAVDIFDGIDGELARLTFQSTPRGSLYDTISDNCTLFAFFGATLFTAYYRGASPLLLITGVVTLVLFVFLVGYVSSFTHRYYGHAHLRLFETRFMSRIPSNDNPLVKLIFALRHLYTKDIYSAAIALVVFLNRPDWAVYIAAVMILAAVWGYTYLGTRYRQYAAGS